MKSCSICNKPFTPKFNTMQKVCSIDCAQDAARLERENDFRKETRERKKKLQNEDRSYQLKKTQQVFNAYIRIRDQNKDCVSCGKPNDGSHQRHASHYRSVKACSSLRFNTWNVHASCMQCNAILSGNLIEYRIRLIKRVGLERVEWLESKNDIARYGIDYLIRLQKILKKKIKRLEKKKCVK